MNKKLVAFLLSTGILVSTCGTAFANNNDGRVNNTNTVAPTPPTTQVEGQITNDIVNIPANEEKPDFEIHDITLLKKDFDNKAKECEKLINEINKLTIILDKEGVEIKRVTEDYKKGMREAHERGEDLAEIIKKFDTLKDPLIQKTLSNEECDKYNNLCKQLEKAMNDLADIGNTIAQTPHIDSSRLSDECREKYYELLSDVIAVTGKYTKEINEHATNMDKLWKTSREALVTLQQELENPAPKEPSNPPEEEKVKDVELPPFPVSGDMQKEIDQMLKDCRAEYEKILSNVNNIKSTETSRQNGRLIDKYNEQVIDIHEKYYNIFHENSNILGDLLLKHDLKYENYKAEMDKYDKYLREIDNIEEEALDDLDRIDEEYSDKIDKAYEALDKKTTNTTSTVSETGSRIGSSRIGSSSIDSSDFDSIPSSTSISRLGTKNPKTGEYTTLGASIATMIAGIAGIFVSRKR